ncbi:Dyp-type peroxidase [Spirosoma montaniterrae]|uniref:Peroxidase n=1 Tax=Spirosoma montaniterrae TaxID=1178516 RepID=A0A1P9WSW8_9BACT|nr:Dyp-type peroxidase [Spirosoma montaniterrae]AQG78481.1 hypothetical protein AWR27_03475 [Spirosoma montaniterrae]
MKAPESNVELADVQGLLAGGYGKLPVAQFILLQIIDAQRATYWLRRLADDLTNAAQNPDDGAVNLAFTLSGFQALGMPQQAWELFSQEFQQSMAAPHRAKKLGDLNESDPKRWQWGGPSNQPIDLLLMLYARSLDELNDRLTTYQAGFAAGGVQIVHLPAVSAPASLEKEHFGFVDGISQPAVEGLPRSATNSFAQNTTRTGEFILGYPNQYNCLPDRVVWQKSGLPDDDFSKNGTYVVFRQLEQDVRGFWTSARQAAQKLHKRADADTCLQVAAKWIGRSPDGTPTTYFPNTDKQTDNQPPNDFAYAQADPHGLGCPLGAHIRRANPRDALGPTPDISAVVSSKHRLLRRGRLYGPPLVNSMAPADMLAALDEQATETEPRGLYFIALNANLSRQFEFVQQTWLLNGKFGGLYNDADPIMGRAPFTTQAEPFAQRTDSLPAFVTVRGGAYFFMPGLRAIRLLTE